MIPIANPEVSEAAKAAVEDVLDSGMLADGEEVRAFEDEFASFAGTEHAVATSSGTTALHAMLEAAGIGEGDLVVTTPFSFVASANAIVHAGAEPVFADVDPETCNLDPDAVRERVEEGSGDAATVGATAGDASDGDGEVAAILAVHLYGLPAPMAELAEIAEEHDLLLLEDAAQAHGASYRGEPVGSLGDAAAFSFYPTKNMTTGEGGAVTTDDDGLAERLRSLVDHGRSGRYTHETVGYNYRMTNVAAAIGRDQLERLPDWVERRRDNAAALTERLEAVPGVETPVVSEDCEHAFHQYTVRVEDREAATDALETADVGYGIYYPETIPGQPAYGGERGWPVAERLSEEVLSLPVHPGVDESDVETIAGALSEVASR